MNDISVFDCSLIELPKVHYREGNISFVENQNEVPFKIKRVFYLYDIPGGISRGAHAHKECHQFLIAASGGFEVMLDDGKVRKTVMLNQPYRGLHIPPGIWGSEINFSSGSICLVFTSHLYNESDYIREYEEFLEFKLKSNVAGN